MENAEGLTYDSEHNLSREPLKADLLHDMEKEHGYYLFVG